MKAGWIPASVCDLLLSVSRVWWSFLKNPEWLSLCISKGCVWHSRLIADCIINLCVAVGSVGQTSLDFLFFLMRSEFGIQSAGRLTGLSSLQRLKEYTIKRTNMKNKTVRFEGKKFGANEINK
ncbi:hypothetical protein CAPTEDRAFT_221540 [Capitella teleta]|uniref:Uncharacterized protein n=1 Tax=Capitella teleta TaxID=283909 RepID=R7T8F6_CAPTE|nr:hypothetical protein CAPTEDRAFT_221540 [Capitella teleta]|eukprot:ELT89713.1 hypothetical protein CAPTEDRAFT_221540 [Capitella teleta]